MLMYILTATVYGFLPEINVFVFGYLTGVVVPVSFEVISYILP